MGDDAPPDNDDDDGPPDDDDELMMFHFNINSKLQFTTAELAWFWDSFSWGNEIEKKTQIFYIMVHRPETDKDGFSIQLVQLWWKSPSNRFVQFNDLACTCFIWSLLESKYGRYTTEECTTWAEYEIWEITT